jgi:four helix bundle protein
MGFKTVDEIHAYNLTRSFKLEVYRLIRSSPEARRDWRFRSQIREALAGAESNIEEGFARWVAGDFAHFLSFTKASLKEGLSRLQDGIDREYFRPAECVEAERLGIRALKASTALQTSLRRLAEENRLRNRHRTPRKPPPKDLGPRTEDLGPRTEDLGPRTEDLGPRTEDLGPGTKDQGPGT